MSLFAAGVGLPRFAVATGVAVAGFARRGEHVEAIARHVRRVIGRRGEDHQARRGRRRRPTRSRVTADDVRPIAAASYADRRQRVGAGGDIRPDERIRRRSCRCRASVVPLKNSTRVSCPSGSDAFAVSAIVAGAVNDAPFVGLSAPRSARRSPPAPSPTPRSTSCCRRRVVGYRGQRIGAGGDRGPGRRIGEPPCRATISVEPA